jgi:SpoVK/Ycf46/Vps4 family AAA+-type ATPase
MVSIDVTKPTKTEQNMIWKSSLEEEQQQQQQRTAMNVTKDSLLDTADLDSEIRRLVNQFDLDVHSIRSVVTTDSLRSALATSDKKKIFSALWSSAVKVARPRMGELSQRVIPRATVDDIVLPERNRLLLKSIIVSVKHRYRVYDEWGFGTVSNDRGLGTTAVFSGPSGTGKTMAAEVIAHELGIDLFKIDLSMVVNKYIGETEKNLKRVFDAAESGGAVLLFDEADALFGKRSEVKDSHDRYANIEVGYLLQRMESYRGLAILTTNMKNSLDSAFLRRIRFMVNFAMPDEKSRQEIWKRVFPKPVPTKDLDFGLLSKLEIAGGHIRNIALGAAFLAAEEGVPVNMKHLHRAVQQEYDKMERPLPAIKWQEN